MEGSPGIKRTRTTLSREDPEEFIYKLNKYTDGSGEKDMNNPGSPLGRASTIRSSFPDAHEHTAKIAAL